MWYGFWRPQGDQNQNICLFKLKKESTITFITKMFGISGNKGRKNGNCASCELWVKMIVGVILLAGYTQGLCNHNHSLKDTHRKNWSMEVFQKSSGFLKDICDLEFLKKTKVIFC